MGDRVRGSPSQPSGQNCTHQSEWRRGREHVFGIKLVWDLETGILVTKSATSQPSDSVSPWTSPNLRFFICRVTALGQMSARVSSSRKIHNLKREQKTPALWGSHCRNTCFGGCVGVGVGLPQQPCLFALGLQKN